MTRKLFLIIVGALCLVAGISLVLSWWPIVVLLFKGIIGMVLALVGMLIIFLAQQ